MISNKRLDVHPLFFAFLELLDEAIGDDDVFVLESIAEAQKNKENKIQVTMVISLRDGMASMARIIKVIEVNNGDIVHMETRESHHPESRLDALLKIEILHSNLLHFIKTLRRCNTLSSVNLLSSKSINIKCKSMDLGCS